MKKISFYSKALVRNLDDANLVEQDGINSAAFHFKPLLAFWPQPVYCFNDNANVTQKNNKTEAMIMKRNKLIENGIFLNYKKIDRRKISKLDEMSKFPQINKITLESVATTPVPLNIPKTPVQTNDHSFDKKDLNEKVAFFQISADEFIKACIKDKPFLYGLKKADRNNNYAMASHSPPILLFQGKYCIPNEISQKFFKRIHETAFSHATDAMVTLKYLHDQGFHMANNQVKKFINSCNTCAIKKHQTSKMVKHEPKKMEVANRPFKKVWLDIFYFEKHSFLLIKDDCTNFVIARNIPDKSSQTILKTLTDIFNLFGITPPSVRADAEHNFSFLKEHFKDFETSFAYRHQGNKAENASRCLKRMLRILSSEVDIESDPVASINSAVVLHNTIYKRHLKNSPVSLLYGASEEDLAQSFANREKQQNRDLNRSKVHTQKLEIDDIVLRKDHSNGNSVFNSTFYVIVELKSTFAILKEYGSDSAKTLKVSLNDLKLVTISDLFESKQEIETQKFKQIVKQKKRKEKRRKTD